MGESLCVFARELLPPSSRQELCEASEARQPAAENVAVRPPTSEDAKELVLIRRHNRYDALLYELAQDEFARHRASESIAQNTVEIHTGSSERERERERRAHGAGPSQTHTLGALCRSVGERGLWALPRTSRALSRLAGRSRCSLRHRRERPGWPRLVQHRSAAGSSFETGLRRRRSPGGQPGFALGE